MARTWLGWWGRIRSNSSGTRRGRSAARSLAVEPLEDRRVLASLADLSGLDLGPLGPLDLDPTSHRPTSLLVQFRDTVRASAAAPGTWLGETWGIAPGLRKVELAAGVDWQGALAAYRQNPNVLFAEPDFRVSLQLMPNDPQFGGLYGLHNVGQGGGIPDADIDAPEAWDVTTGSRSVIVAVIDTGVDYTHPDLAANMWRNVGEIPGNRIDDDGNGYVDDIHGFDFVNNDGDPMDDHFHGTHVAGTIGAVGDNEIGITGVSWQVQIMALKFLDASGGGYISDAIKALNYAVANGAFLSNNSWGGGGFSQAFMSALQNARTAGHIFVAAAGNEGINTDLEPFYPAGYNINNVVSVAATDNRDELAWFSNYGRSSVDLAAPGVNIYSTFPTRMTEAMRSGGYSTSYETISGTSMATPHVSGVLALVKAVHPDWTYDEIIDQVLATVDPLPALSRTVTGGRLNAAAAVGNPPADVTGPRVVSSDPVGAVTGSVSQIRLRFSEKIDLTTIDVSDIVRFDGPDGPIVITAIAPVAGSSDRQFDITFATQSTEGQYTLVIGPQISDLEGNLMNQDGDADLGEDPEDQFTARFTIVGALVYHSNDVPAPLPPFNLLISYLTIDEDVLIADLNLTLNITHPDVSNLMIYLTSPSGTSAFLSYGSGGPGEGFVNTTFDDEADTPIAEGASPFTGRFRPDDPLGEGEGMWVFDGESTAGTWELYILNFSFRNRGELTAWSLEVSPAGGAPPPSDPGGGEDLPPVAVDDQFHVESGSTLIIDPNVLLANDYDPNGDPLGFIGINNLYNGSITPNMDGTLTFEPLPDFVGRAGFQYVISDGWSWATANVIIDVQPRFLWNNHRNPLDVNNDAHVSPVDALLIFNLLNAGRTGELAFVIEGLQPNLYVDVAPDNYVSPLDALLVINYLNAYPSGTSASPAAIRGTAAAASSAPTSTTLPSATALATGVPAPSAASLPHQQKPLAVDRLDLAALVEQALFEFGNSRGAYRRGKR